MEAIEAATPPGDGLAYFNRMYLGVTQQVNNELGQQFFADPAFMTTLDVAFANLYFGAAAAGHPAAVRLAWRPLIERRAAAGIEPIQFALVGMNAHINYDLPCLLPCHAAGCYRRLRVTWVTPLGLFTASIWNRSSSPSSPSQSRSPRPSTIGTTTMCA